MFPQAADRNREPGDAISLLASGAQVGADRRMVFVAERPRRVADAQSGLPALRESSLPTNPRAVWARGSLLREQSHDSSKPHVRRQRSC